MAVSPQTESSRLRPGRFPPPCMRPHTSDIHRRIIRSILHIVRGDQIALHIPRRNPIVAEHQCRCRRIVDTVALPGIFQKILPGNPSSPSGLPPDPPSRSSAASDSPESAASHTDKRHAPPRIRSFPDGPPAAHGRHPAVAGTCYTHTYCTDSHESDRYRPSRPGFPVHTDPPPVWYTVLPDSAMPYRYRSPARTARSPSRAMSPIPFASTRSPLALHSSYGV